MSVIEMSVPEETTIEPPVETVTFNWTQWLTVERALYGLLLLLAGSMRFFALGQQPLRPLEAANVWPAWLAATATTAPTSSTPTSALLYALQTLLFWAANGSDDFARFLPALFGVGLIWLLWYWRAWLGPLTALLAAGLLVFDPWLVAFSRLADGANLSLFFGLATLISLTQLLALAPTDPARAWWQKSVGVCAGLLLVSGVQAWSWVPVLVLCLLLFGRPASTAEEEQTAWWSPQQLGQWGFSRTMLIFFVAAAVLGATGWLVRLEGLGLVSRSLTVWFGQLFGRAGFQYPLTYPFLRLLVDEPLLLIFGLLGLAQLWLARRANDNSGLSLQGAVHGTDRWPLFLTLWLVWGLLLALLPGRNPFCLPMIGLPLLLATAQLGERLLQQYRANFAWRESLLVLLMLVVLLTSTLFWAVAFISHREVDSSLARTTLAVFGLAVLLVVAYAYWSERTQTRFMIGSFVGLLLLLLTLASSWQLNHQFDTTYASGFFADYTHPDVRRLAQDINTLSAQRNGDPYESPLQVQMAGEPDPVLGWYLRNMRRLAWVLAPGVNDQAALPLVVTLSAQADTSDLSAKYMGSRYALHVRWLPPALLGGPKSAGQSEANPYWAQRLQPFLRWLLYREAKPLPGTDGVVLWVPAQGQ